MLPNLEIIAEIGSIHDGSFGNALKAIDAAAKCGATTLKFQTHIADAETLIDAPSPPYFSSESRVEYFKRTAFNIDQWIAIAKHCKELGVEFMSSPFSVEAVDLLYAAGVDAYKIPSGEVTNTPMLERVASTGKRVVLSTGMSSWEEIDRAVNIFSDRDKVSILQCTSRYPCEPNFVGLNILVELMDRYKTNVGLSDHTDGFAAAISAVALGACIIEKHFTFSRLMYGSDASFGMEPKEFELLCRELSNAYTMRNSIVDKNNLSMFHDMKRIFQKSIVASKNLEKGAKITMDDLSFKKPGDGICASEYHLLVGKVLKYAVPKDYKFSWSSFE